MFDPNYEVFHTNNVPFSTFNSSAHTTRGSYDSWGNRNYGARARKTAQNYENYSWKADGGELEFTTEDMDDKGKSGVCSPPLWKTSPPRSPVHGNLSPNSRSQAIVRGQRELMEMARKMPDSCYELSLRDIVETTPVNAKEEGEEVCLVEEKKKNFGSRKSASLKEIIKRQKSNKNNMIDHENMRGNMRRSASMGNGGLLLNMALPISLRSNRNKSRVKISTSSRVSPKVETSGKSSSSSDHKDWWKKRFSGSWENSTIARINSGSSKSTKSGSSKSTSSSGDGGGNNNDNRRKSNGWSSVGCWSFFRSRKNKRKGK